MNERTLEEKLCSMTKSEMWHQDNPGKLSPRYKTMPQEQQNQKQVYQFSFETVLKENNIYISKPSRFTWIPPHIHSVIEINYVYSGRCTQIINGKQYEFGKGDLCLLDTNTSHEILPLGGDDIVINIDMRKAYFSTGFLSRLSSQGIVASFLASAISDHTARKQCLIFRSRSEKMHMLVKQLLCEYYDRQLASSEIIDAYMIIIFSELLRMYQEHNIYDSSQSDLIRMLQYIEKNYGSVTLTSMANAFSFHPTYLSDYLKKHTGKTFKELVIIQRMSRACFYLSNGDMPVCEIAHDVGYNNLGFFYKKFQELYGVSPQEYRKITAVS